MGTRVSFPVDVKMKAIEMRLAEVPVKEVMEELNIRNYTQLKTWMSWYRNAYQKAVKEKGITMSMTRKGTPADNSPIETFHSTLKSETFYLDDIYRTTNAHVIQIVEEYIN